MTATERAELFEKLLEIEQEGRICSHGCERCTAKVNAQIDLMEVVVDD